MWQKYFRLLSRPGAAAFAFSGLLSRLPISMVNISVTLLVQLQYDSYATAGTIAAIGAVAWALQTVPTARLTDKVGQRAAMLPLAGLHIGGVVLLIATAMQRGPLWLVAFAAVLTSLSGPLGSLTRARWSHILTSDKDIHTAFSLEGALDEVLFIGGPAVATYLSVAVYPPLGLIVSTVGFAVGLFILLRQRETEPPARRTTGATSLGWRIPSVVWAVALIAAAMGAMFGALDISIVGFAESLGQKDLAGVVLAMFAVGSFAGGLWYGGRDWHAPLRTRLIVALMLVAVGFTIMSQAPNLLVAAAVGVFAGASIAPALTSIDNAVQRSVPPHQLTEGLAWLRIGLGLGVSAGVLAAGFMIEHVGPRAGLEATAAAGVLAAGIGVSIWGILKRGVRADLPDE